MSVLNQLCNLFTQPLACAPADTAGPQSNPATGENGFETFNQHIRRMLFDETSPFNRLPASYAALKKQQARTPSPIPAAPSPRPTYSQHEDFTWLKQFAADEFGPVKFTNIAMRLGLWPRAHTQPDGTLGYWVSPGRGMTMAEARELIARLPDPSGTITQDMLVPREMVLGAGAGASKKGRGRRESISSVQQSEKQDRPSRPSHVKRHSRRTSSRTQNLPSTSSSSSHSRRESANKENIFTSTSVPHTPPRQVGLFRKALAHETALQQLSAASTKENTPRVPLSHKVSYTHLEVLRRIDGCLAENPLNSKIQIYLTFPPDGFHMVHFLGHSHVYGPAKHQGVVRCPGRGP